MLDYEIKAEKIFSWKDIKEMILSDIDVIPTYATYKAYDDGGGPNGTHIVSMSKD